MAEAALTMLLTRENSRSRLQALRLPSVVIDIFDGSHPALGYRCQSPYYVFRTAIDSLDENLIPLWECGINVTAFRHTEPKGAFVKISLEAPNDVMVLGATFTAVVASVLMLLWEDETPEGELREVAALMEFNEIDRFLREVESAPSHESLGDFQLRRLQFLEGFEANEA